MGVEQVSPAGLIASVLPSQSEKVKKWMAAYVVASAAYVTAKNIYHRQQAKKFFRVSVSGDDPIYGDVHDWLYNLLLDEEKKSLSVRTAKQDSDFLESYNEREYVVRLQYDGSQIQEVKINGHKISVLVEKPESSPTSEQGKKWAQSYEKITFTAQSILGRDEIVKMLKAIAEDKSSKKNQPDFYIGSPWGSWDRRDDLPARSLDTVALPGNELESIIDDFKEFFDNAERYEKLGLPYHRGYLFHGPPGTGKTSLAKAIANHFNMDVYYLPLCDLEEDSRLLKMVSCVDKGSMLLLEDIDVLSVSRERSAETSSEAKISLSGLLNALDGIASPHGLVTVMTTNHIELLDPALIRPGRIDIMKNLGYIENDQLEKLWKLAFGSVPAFPDIRKNVTPADVVDVIKRNMHSPDVAYREVIGII